MSTDLSHPAAVMARLEEIDSELAVLQNTFEDAAMRWFKLKRQREHQQAVHFMKANEQPTAAAREARAKELTSLIGMEEEAMYEAAKAKVRVLETRTSIGQSILKAQGRG